MADYRIAAEINPDEMFGFWSRRAAILEDVFAADPEIAEVRCELIDAVTPPVTPPDESFPVSIRFYYYDRKGDELSVAMLAYNPKLAKAAWEFEQLQLPLLEDVLFRVMDRRRAPNAVWSISFAHGGLCYIRTPDTLPDPHIIPLVTGGLSFHQHVATIDAIAQHAGIRKSSERKRSSLLVSASEHDRRVTELINYASEQVTRRRALGNAIRGLIADGTIPADRIEQFEQVLAANGPI